MRYAKLKGRIKECYGSESDFAKAMGINKQTLYSKFKNKKGMSIPDVAKMCDLLQIPDSEIRTYFF